MSQKEVRPDLSARATTTATTTEADAAKYIAGLRRRRAHARRVPPLACGCCADPWTCRCTDEPITDVRATAAIDAAELLEAMGIPGIFDQDRCRAMWRLGRRDLSVRCYRNAVGEVA